MTQAGQATVVAAFVALTACSPVEPEAEGDGVLVLEVGGDQPSLRAALLNLGQQVGPPRRLRVEPESLPATVTVPPASGSEPQSAPEPPAPYFVVELAEGETLIHLARRHLGDGRRYVELLECNGWTESDARRLRAGREVRIPRSPAAGARGR